ncbi:MAG: carbohydrate ABC transporter permease [Hungatella sp.]|nr:carbohydrate ABC transporter permease [Hungatella sp.]
MTKTKAKKLLKRIFFALAIGAYLLFALFPFFVMIAMSFSSKFAIMGVDTPIWPKKPILKNYERMWQVVPLLKYIKNSLIVCSSTVMVSLLMSVPASYALSRFRFRGKKAFSISILATQLFPGITMLLPIYLMYVNFTKLTGIPMTKTLHGLVVAFATFGIPYSIWMLKSYFDSIPDELEQAAMIDGCSRTKAMVRVVLPLVVPGMVATGLYVFLLAWNNILFAGVLTDQATRTFATGLQEFASESSTEYGLLMAACSVTTIPIVALFFVFQKYFVGGMTGGAVKG